MEYSDQPFTLGQERWLLAREAMLREAHIRPLTEYVDELRTRLAMHVPYFDPMDGGTEAEMLFLFEKPGPKAEGSGFISRNNPDQTARNTFELMQEAGIERQRTVLWNVVPAWNGTRKVTAQERRDGVAELRQLLPLLPKLTSIVLVGNNAHKARQMVEEVGLPVFESAHPSPLVRNISSQLYGKIAGRWKDAASLAPDT